MGNILSKPKAPPIPEPVELPDPDDNKLQQAKRQAAAKRAQESGLAATRLSERGQNKTVGE